MVKGAYSVQVQDAILPGAPGTLFVFPPGMPHAVRAEEQWKTHILLFRQGSHIIAEDVRTLRVGHDLLLHNEGRPQDELTSGLLYIILRRIRGFEERLYARGSLHPGVERAVGFLEAHVFDRIRSRDVADAAYLSHGHLCRLFNAAFGKSPMRYHL